ncbi:MAG: right-handed parallel beta-helix repeat-containing protein, partial [Prevotellaceae bacterium]|nr:right-handed parallel beta-helix repeat-containing protein [Prevotellaceae bacterium]
MCTFFMSTAHAQFSGGSLSARNDIIYTGPLQKVKKNIIRNDTVPGDNYSWQLLTSLNPATQGTLTKEGDYVVFTPASGVRNTTFVVNYRLSNNYTHSDAVINIIVSQYNNPTNVIDPDLDCVDSLDTDIQFGIKRKYQSSPRASSGNWIDAMTSPLVGDLNGDGKPEIVIMGNEGISGTGASTTVKYINIYNGQDGTRMCNHDIGNIDMGSPYHRPPSILALGDLDNDGIGEIVMCNAQTGKVRAYKPTFSGSTITLTEMWVGKANNVEVSYKAPLTSTDEDDFGYPMPYIADLNADGIPEVIVYNKIFNGATGALLMSWQNEATQANPKTSSIATGSSTNGLETLNYLDPLTSTNASNLRGKAMTGRRPGNGTYAEPYLAVPAIVDIDGDGQQEIITGNRIHKFTFNSLENHLLNTYYTIEGPQSETVTEGSNASGTNTTSVTYNLSDGHTRVADIDGDGQLDIIVVTYGNNGSLTVKTVVFVWDTNNLSQVKACVSFYSYGANGNISIPFVGDINGEEDGWDGAAWTRKLPEICILGGGMYINRSSSGDGRTGVSFHPTSDDKIRRGAVPTGTSNSSTASDWNNNNTGNTNRRFNRASLNSASGFDGHIIGLTWDASATNVWEKLKVSWGMEHSDRSNSTGITLFDFDNNNTADLCYRDERTLRVVSPAKAGNDYVELSETESTPNSAVMFRASVFCGTGFEYPTIADVNMDGSADIIVTNIGSQDLSQSRGWFEVYEYDGAMWAPCPPVWNQGMYDPTQVREDLKINARPPSMLTPYTKNGETIYPLNGSWIQQPIVTQGANYAPAVRKPDVNILNMSVVISGGVTTVTLVIRNDGSASINSQTPIAFYDGTVDGYAIGGGATLITPIQTVGVDIFPDETVTKQYTLNSNYSNHLLWARITDNGTAFPDPGYLECYEPNNVFSGTDCVPPYIFRAVPDTVLCGDSDNVTLELEIGAASENPTFQWYRNDDPIDGATDSTYVATLAGDYKCYITNGPVCRDYTSIKRITRELPSAVADYDTLMVAAAKEINVLSNDTRSVYCNPLPVILTQPTQGTATVQPSGNILYTHTGSVSGTDSLTYTLGGDSAKVYIRILSIKPNATGTVIFVKTTASGTGDGSSWENAYGGLADPLADARTNPGIKQIWVAEGTYYPRRRADNMSDLNSADRDNAFVLVPGVKIYGGFPNDATTASHPTLNTRNPQHYLATTILSGNIGNSSLATDNCYHVVVGAGSLIDGSGDTARLDGFTVMGGNASEPSAITINAVAIDRDYGGGIVLFNGASPILGNLTVSGNQAFHGGGIYIKQSSPVITNMEISGNTADFFGGGVVNHTAGAVMTNVKISGNTAAAAGGGVYNEQVSSPSFTNVLISGNISLGTGGGMYNADDARPLLTNVTIASNRANSNYGGIYFDNTSIRQVRNSIIYGNTAGGSSQNVSHTNAGIYSYSLVGGVSTNAGILFVSDPNFNNPELASSAPTTAGDYTLQQNSIVIDEGEDSYNSTPYDLAGNRRIQGYGIDLGAYETRCVPPTPIQPDAKGIVYVKEYGCGDGSSWEQAYPGLADPLATAKTNTAIKEIWVAEGTYYPKYIPDSMNNIGIVNGLSPRDRAFLLVPGVKIYGGFPANASSGVHDDINTRQFADSIFVAAGDSLYIPIAVHKTILSGDIDMNGDTTGNVYHVVIGAGDLVSGNDTATMDGLTITGGYAYYEAVSGQIERYLSINNLYQIRTRFGGGIYAYALFSSLVLTRTIISGNAACYGGGGICNFSASPLLTSVIISGNAVIANGGSGGGMFNMNSSPVLNHVAITNNTATEAGGGMSNRSSSPMLMDVQISGNTVYGTSTSYFHGGGGIYNYEGYATPSVFNNVRISGNTARYGGGISNISGESPVLTNVKITDNTASESGGGVYNGDEECAPLMTNVLISGNNAGNNGGGICDANYASAFPTLTNVQIIGNNAGNNGGGIYNISNRYRLTNVQITGNTAGNNGGGICDDNSYSYTYTSLEMANITVAGNYAGNTAGGIYKNQYGTTNIRNSIVYGNTDTDANAYDNVYGSPVFFHSMVGGMTKNGTDIVADGNPNFTDLQYATSATPTTAGDYRLQQTSPAIDMGENSYNTCPVDIDGNQRIQGCGIDLGAYEFEATVGPVTPTPDPNTGILYVKVDGCGDGSSWETPYPGLADPLAEAKTNNLIKQIWVAEGTYYPTRAANNLDSINPANRDNAFVLVEGVKIYGGFPANAVTSTHSNINTRQFADSLLVTTSGDSIYIRTSVHKTILSGDIGTQGDNTDNAYHVVIGAGNLVNSDSDTARLDGFTITDGNANVNNAGLSVNTQIVSRTLGAGIALYGGTSSLLENLIISNNAAAAISNAFGGGIFITNSSPVLNNVLISDNSATNTGGGIYNNAGSSPVLNNVQIINNSAASGGGIHNLGSLTLTNSKISGNTVTSQGGGILNNTNVALTLTNVQITGNTASNATSQGGGIRFSGMANVTFTNVQITGNTAGGSGGGIYFWVGNGNASLTNVKIAGNTASSGGGIYVQALIPNATFTNIQITGNKANNQGGGIYLNTATTKLTNATIAGNYADNTGSAIYINTGTLTLQNSIIYGNTGGGSPVYNSPIYSFCLLDGVGLNGTQYVAEGDPLFEDLQYATSLGATSAGDYRLKVCSPCIGVGYDSYNNSSVDLDGNNRLNGTIDLGAYEYAGGAGTISPVNGIVYVKETATGTGDGSSWENAYAGLADPLAAAKTMTCIKEIWVAEGTYYPTRRADDLSNANPLQRNNAFVLVAGVKIYGGFPDTASTALHSSISDRAFTDSLFVAAGDSLYIKVAAHQTILSGDLDKNDNGTSITGDNAFHVVIGADNLVNGNDTATLDGFTITGGNTYNSTFTITVNTKNIVYKDGGGIYNHTASPVLRNLIISGNRVVGPNSHGGGMYNQSSFPELTNVVISGNTSGRYGGGIYNDASSPILNDVQITGNTVTGTNGSGGGMYNYNYSNPNLTNVQIANNTATHYGGGMYNNSNSSPTLTYVVISGNTASAADGGGMYNTNSSNPIMSNVLISGNTTGNSGGGMYNNNSVPELTNVTISGNYASADYGGVYFSDNNTLQVRNSIIYGNTSGGSEQNVSHEDEIIYANSLVENATLNAGIILNSNPMFVDFVDASFAPTDSGDYRLQPCSPAIDAGDSSLNHEAFDLDGNVRIFNDSIDLGAYENIAIRALADSTNIVINDTAICYNTAITLTPTATGVAIPVFRWYSSQTETYPFHTGASYTTSALTTDTTFYISVSG